MKKWMLSVLVICFCALGMQNVKAATTQEVVDYLKGLDEFQLLANGSGKIVYENDAITISYIGYDEKEHSYVFPCKDNVLDYTSGEITSYEEAEETVSYIIWGTYLLQAALEVNGCSTEQIMAFNASANGGDYERYGFELKETGKEVTFTQKDEDGEESTVSVMPFSLKVDFERATVPEVETTSGQTTVSAGKSYTAGTGQTKATYKVISAKKRTVVYSKSLVKKTAKKATVPAKVKLADGNYYKVIGIGTKAFAKKSKVKTVVVKSKTLKKKRCKKCLTSSKVKTVKIAVGTKKANKKYRKTYKAYFQKKNSGKAVKIK